MSVGRTGKPEGDTKVEMDVKAWTEGENVCELQRLKRINDEELVRSEESLELKGTGREKEK